MDLVADASTFRSPPMNFRPMFRWWWPADTYQPMTLVAELQAMHDAGFGGAEIAFNPGGWAGPAQRTALHAVLLRAKKLGMKIDMTIGASWPIVSPAVTPQNGLAEQEVSYGTKDVVGPAPYTGALPDARNGGDAGKLLAVVAGKVAVEGQPGSLPNGCGSVPYTDCSLFGPTASPQLERSTLVDLTKNVDSAGHLTWQVPAGHWVVTAVRTRVSAEGKQTPAVMDHLNHAAVDAVTGYVDAKQVGTDNVGLLRATGGAFFEDSLEIDATDMFYTPGLAKAFKAHRGYDVTKYWPVLFSGGMSNNPVSPHEGKPAYALSDGTDFRARHDLYQTLTDLYIDEHMLPFQKWATSLGVRYRCQCAYGELFDTTRSNREVTRAGGIGDDETLNAGDPAPPSSASAQFAEDHYRTVTSGVHQGGGDQVNSELGAMFGHSWMVGLQDLRALMNKQWALGVTRPIIHGFASTPVGTTWPGRDQFGGLVSDSWNQHDYPMWNHFGELTDYWARGTEVLESGKPSVDVAVYFDGFVTSAAPLAAIPEGLLDAQAVSQLPSETGIGGTLSGAALHTQATRLYDGNALTSAGYTYDFLDAQGLTDPAAGQGPTAFPDGPAYRAVVIDQRFMPGASAQALLAMARRGLKVVFVGTPPTMGASLRSPAIEDAQVRSAVAALRTLPNVAFAATQTAVAATLRRLGVQPATAHAAAPALHTLKRSTRDVDYYYLWNGGTSALDTSVTFASTGAPYTLDLASGSIDRLAEYVCRARRTTVPVSLAPGQTQVIAFRKHEAAPLHVVGSTAPRLSVRSGSTYAESSQPGTYRVSLSNGTMRELVMPNDLAAPQSITSWHLHVAESSPSGAIPHDTTLTSLEDWRTIPGLQHVSGIGTYSAEVTIPAAALRSDHGMRLSLGAVDGSYEIYVNGHRANGQGTSDLAYAEPGGRSLATGDPIDVSRLLRTGRNSIKIVVATTLKNEIQGQVLSAGTFPALAPAEPATQPYGLRGPVTINPFASVAIVSATKLGVAAGRPAGSSHLAGGRLAATGLDMFNGTVGLALLGGAALLRRRRHRARA